MLFGVLMAIRAAFSMGSEVAGADRLMMIHKVSIIQPLPQSYGDRIRHEGVTEVTHANWFGGYYQEPSNFVQRMAVDPETWLQMYPEFEVPPEQKKAWSPTAPAPSSASTGQAVRLEGRRPRPAAARRSTAEATARRGSSPSTASTTRRSRASTRRSSSSTTTTSTRASADYPDGGQVGWYVIRVADPSTAGSARQAIDAMFANSPETKTATEKAFVSDFAKQIGDIGAIMIAIAGDRDVLHPASSPATRWRSRSASASTSSAC